MLRARLKASQFMMSVRSCGRVFHSRGPATEKALSPKTVLVVGMSNWPLAAARSLFRPGMLTERGQCHECIVGIDSHSGVRHQTT